MIIKTYPLCHVKSKEPWLSILWLKELNKCYIDLPFFIVHDIGHILMYSHKNLTINPPEFLQKKFNTSSYLDLLNTISRTRIIREIQHRTISDSILSALIYKLVNGISFPENIKNTKKSGIKNKILFMNLEHILKTKTQYQVWRDMEPDLRANPDQYLSQEVLSKIRLNLKNLHGQEISFLIKYGPQIWGHTDMNQVMDIFSFLDIPWSGRHILSQMLRLIPIVKTGSKRKGGQVYPMGGYEGISNKGEIDNLVPSEFCYEKEILSHRILNHESMYYSRESIPKQENELALLITQTGIDMKGDKDLLARGLTLALWHQLKQRGYDVYQCFIGDEFTSPKSLNSINDLNQILYYKDLKWHNPVKMLELLIQTIKKYNNKYPEKHLYWLLNQNWDADFYKKNHNLYEQINQICSTNQAWFIQIAETPQNPPKISKYFSNYQIITNQILKESEILSHLPSLKETKAILSKAKKQDRLEKKFTNSIGMTFVLIPAGVFMMGSPEDESGRYDREQIHEVRLTQDYYMQTTPVTQEQWQKVMGTNPSRFKEGGLSCPVENVSWDNAQEFIEKLNQSEGTDKYCLPTEAQWEYACRAGTNTPFYFGKCLSTDQANYNGNYPLSNCPKGEYRGKTIPVGSFEPNADGLYDMHGNIWEWCQDIFDSYPESSVIDPTGAEKGGFRVFRSYDNRKLTTCDNLNLTTPF